MTNEQILEKIPVRVFPNENNESSIQIARLIAEIIQANNQNNKKTVLGLATGHTPLDVYRELVRMRQQDNLSFKNVITFNLDEYYGLPPEDHRSYHRFMKENLFNGIDILPENIHIPDGLIPLEKIDEHCANYEKDIAATGGIDIQILGIGRDGHIGFNEPGSSIHSRTRLLQLDEVTRKDALSDFEKIQYVPRQAITMGISTIMEAKNVILIARGDHKAAIVKEAVEGPITEKVAASYLQKHPNATIFADQAASSALTRFKTPWLVKDIDWSETSLANRAICYLSEKLKKPILKLSPNDFHENQIEGLAQMPNLQELKENLHQKLAAKIKTAEELPKEKNILLFSPHPDDDVISLGGVLQKLIANQNNIRTVYMTPGYNAVFDHAVENFILQRYKFSQSFRIVDEAASILSEVSKFLDRKKELPFGSMDSPDVLKIKTVIRMVEAISACEFLGVKNYDFLEMPFYRTGGAKKMPITEQDVQIISDLLDYHQPHIVFAADDLNDPNGTHRLCLNAIKQALKRYRGQLQVYFYRGAWQEFHPLEATDFIPLSPDEITIKREAIFRHESQKDEPPLPGNSNLEFWQRAERRNKATAELLKNYGLGEHFAVESLRMEG